MNRSGGPRARALFRRSRKTITVLLDLFERGEVEVVLQLEVGFVIALPGKEIDNQGFLDREDGVVGDVLVPPVEDLRDDRLAPGRRDDEVDVPGPHRMAVQQAQQPARGSVQRDRVARGAQAVEGVISVFAGREAAAEVEVHLVLVLLLVEAVGRRVPHVQLGAFDRLVGEVVAHDAVHVGVVAVRDVVHDAAAHGASGGVGAPEGAEDGGRGGEGGGFADELVGDFIDEGLEAYHVREQLRFVASCGHAAGFVDLRVVAGYG